MHTDSESASPAPAGGGDGRRGPARAIGTVVGALGVVFGDIGTSPIYTIQTVFNPDDPHPVPISTDNVYGVVSLIFWSVMIIVTFTYVTLVLRADNHGEGGIMALITLLGKGVGRRTVTTLSALGIFGAALFFGDSTAGAAGQRRAQPRTARADHLFRVHGTPKVRDALALLDASETEGPIAIDEASSPNRVDQGFGADDGVMAQEPVHCDLVHHGRRRCIFRPAV